MTRNTRLYKAKFIDPKGCSSVTFRTLTVEEISWLSRIKNNTERNYQAGLAALIDKTELSWTKVVQIGEQTMLFSTKCIEDSNMFEILVKETRENVLKDPILIGLTHLLKLFPGQSITELMKLTYADIIELVCFGEVYADKALFNIKGFKSQASQKKGMRLVNNETDSDQTLEEKMKKLNGFINA